MASLHVATHTDMLCPYPRGLCLVMRAQFEVMRVVLVPVRVRVSTHEGQIPHAMLPDPL